MYIRNSEEKEIHLSQHNLNDAHATAIAKALETKDDYYYYIILNTSLLITVVLFAHIFYRLMRKKIYRLTSSS